MGVYVRCPHCARLDSFDDFGPERDEVCVECGGAWHEDYAENDPSNYVDFDARNDDERLEREGLL
jgi:uncharacterized protein (DUF983 family)